MKQMFMLALLLLIGANVHAVCNANFTTSVQANGQLQLTNTSTFSGYSTYAGATYQISWGDGLYYNSGPGYPLTVTNHGYGAAGTYTINMTMQVFDSSVVPASLVCTSTHSQTVTITVPACTFGIAESGTGLTKTFSISGQGTLPSSSFSWNFGDGTTGTGSPVTHTYAYGAYYGVSASSTACQGSGAYLTSAVHGPVNCDSVGVSFTYTNGTLQATSYPVNAPYSGDSVLYYWNFGNSTSSTNGLPNQSPTYSVMGNYTVTVTVRRYSANAYPNYYCQKSYTQTISVGPAPLGAIGGYVIRDTMNGSQDTFKVWLITHDIANNTLTAVDSVLTGGYGYGFYSFPAPAGDYLVKAALLTGPSSGTGYIPTYYGNALYWSNATVINHGNQNNYGYSIQLQQGTITSGPGFVGGSIALGANKGTGSGMAGVTVLIRNAAMQVLQFSTTDSHGGYQFSNLPVGTYTIYPEMTGYTTTPITVTITAAAPSSTDNGFVVSRNGKSVTPGSLGFFSSTVRSAGLQLSPNPTSGTLNLRWTAEGQQPVSIRVVNSLGLVVYQSELQNTGSAELQLNNLPRGNYWLRLNTGTTAETKQVTLN